MDDIYQVDIYNSRFAKHFVRHQRMISISTTRFGLRNRSLHALDINIVAKKMKEISKATSLSQLYKSCSPKLSYLFIPMSTVLSHAKKDRRRISSVIECSDIISRSLNFSAPSSHFKNTQSHSDSSEFSC